MKTDWKDGTYTEISIPYQNLSDLRDFSDLENKVHFIDESRCFIICDDFAPASEGRIPFKLLARLLDYPEGSYYYDSLVVALTTHDFIYFTDKD
jgi:hypothetical protein